MEPVPECQSPLFLHVDAADRDDVRLYFSAPAEAPTTRGFASILARPRARPTGTSRRQKVTNCSIALKLLPEIPTVDPGAPLAGLKLVMIGTTRRWRRRIRRTLARAAGVVDVLDFGPGQSAVVERNLVDIPDEREVIPAIMTDVPMPTPGESPAIKAAGTDGSQSPPERPACRWCRYSWSRNPIQRRCHVIPLVVIQRGPHTGAIPIFVRNLKKERMIALHGKRIADPVRDDGLPARICCNYPRAADPAFDR